MTSPSLFSVFGRLPRQAHPAPVTSQYHERIEDAQLELCGLAGRGEWIDLRVWEFKQHV